MNSFIEKLEPIMTKLSGNRCLVAIRDSLMTLIPFLAVSGIATFFAYVLFSTDSVIGIGGMFDESTLAYIVSFFSRISNATISIMSLMLAFLVPIFIGKQHGYNNPTMMGIIGLALFFIFNPAGSTEYFGTKGVMLAFLVGITSALLFLKLESIDKLKIKIEGASIPEAVSKSFNVLFVIIIMLIIYSLAATVLYAVSGGLEVIEIINTVLQAPLVGFTATPVGMVLYFLASNLLWSFGIHPSAIMAPADAALTVAVTEGHIINYSFIVTYGMVLGTGSLGGLLINLFLSKRKEFKGLAELCALPEFFNITEPLTFGTPICYNLVMMIPFIFVPIINCFIAYGLTIAGLVSPISNNITWSTPIIFKSLIGSNGDIRNLILEIALLVLDVFLWMPFVKAYERQLNKIDKDAEVEAGAEATSQE